MRRRSAFLLLLLPLLGGCGEDHSRPTGFRVAVIGLDGATFDLLAPWMEEGLLPNLKKMRDEGYSSPLQSVIPPLSAPAWTTAITGVNPAKHGVFDFELVDRRRFLPVPATSLDRKAKAVWEYMTDSKRRSVVISVPVTTPPDPIEGVMISGFPHLFQSGYTWPEGLEGRLAGYRLDRYGEYLPPGGEDAFLANLNATREGRARAALDLYKNEDWELFWAVFMGTDKVQHFYWKFMDPEGRDVDPALVEKYGNSIRDFWVRIDEIVGEFVAATDEKTILFVVSDHGFVPVNREIQLLRWLWDEGYCDRNPLKSRLLYFTHLGGRITVNRTDRFPDGVIEPGEEYEDLLADVTARLLEIRDPANGRKVVAEVYRADEILRGPYLEDAPDLFFLPERGYFIGRGSPLEEGELFQEPSFTFSAYHDRRGIFLARGPHVKRGRSETPLELFDLAPTVLRLLGETVPSGMDGGPFEGPFDAGLEAAAPLRVADRPIERDVEDRIDENADRLKELKALPYLQ